MKPHLSEFNIKGKSVDCITLNDRAYLLSYFRDLLRQLEMLGEHKAHWLVNSVSSSSSNLHRQFTRL